MRASFCLIFCAGLAAASALAGTMSGDGMRDTRYGEVLVVRGGPLKFKADVYNTVGLNDCPQAQWEKLDAAALKKEHGAVAVILNGPRYFMMDRPSIEKPGEKVEFGGIAMRRLASVELSLPTILRGRSKPYAENSVNRVSEFLYRKGSEIYELIAPDGRAYVLQTYSRIVDPKLAASDLPGLGRRLRLPEGWQYRASTLDHDLILRSTGTAHVLQDELQNSYQRRGPDDSPAAAR